MLKLINISKIYKSKRGATVNALKGISAEFNENGLVFILGKSGCGKSTLLNLIGGLDSPTTGEIIIDNKSNVDFKATDYDSYRNAYVGFVFQEYNLLDGTVYGNISLALELQGETANRKEVENLLKKLDLFDDNGKSLIDRNVNELSGGQKQRVAIARALVKSPRIILADEPTGALDSETSAAFYDILKTLSKDKLIIVVTHDRENAEKYGDRIIELKDGQLIKDDVSKKMDIKVIKKESCCFQKKLFTKSKLPFKQSFVMGASGLKIRKFRLIISIILSIFAFTVFGFATTAAFFDGNTTTIKQMYDYGHSMMIIESTNFEQVKIDNGNGIYINAHYPAGLSEKQLESIKKYNNNDDLMYTFNVNNNGRDTLKYDLNLSERYFTLPAEYYHYQLGMNNFLVAELDPVSGESDACLVPDIRFLNKEICRLPTKFDEIAITDLHAEMFMRYGYKNDDGSKAQINTPDELIGKQVGEFTIVGVFSTDISIALIDELLFSNNDSDSNYLINIVNGLRGSIISHSFVKTGFFINRDETFKPYNVLIKLSGNLNTDRDLLKDLGYVNENVEKPGEIMDGVMIMAMFSEVISEATYYRNTIVPIGLISGGIFAVVATLLIMFFLNVSFDAKKKEMGILRALGARKKDVAIICLVESLLIAAANFIISIIAVLVICSILNMLFHVPIFLFGFIQILLMFLLCFGVSALATISPVLKTTNKKPIDIINSK